MKTKKIFINSFIGFCLIVCAFIGFVFLRTSFTFSKISADSSDKEAPIYFLPELEDLPSKDKNQLTFLLLGQRGEGQPFGGLLTDALIVVNLNKNNGKITILSLPRDLYVPIPNSTKRDKLNAVYAWGYEKKGVGLAMNYIKDTVSRITGLYVDNAIVINFDGFEKFIDAIGGITIELKENFIEDKQWWCDENGKNCRAFVVPEGKNVLDGEKTLFYIRSRFSSSDFDRARRQQQVLLAVKEKLFSLGFLANPLNIIKMLDLLENNIRTDAKTSDITEFIDYYQKKNIDFNNMTNYVFDNGSDGYLDAKYVNGIYILVPRTGDFTAIREKCLDLVK